MGAIPRLSFVDSTDKANDHLDLTVIILVSMQSIYVVLQLQVTKKNSPVSITKSFFF